MATIGSWLSVLSLVVFIIIIISMFIRNERVINLQQSKKIKLITKQILRLIYPSARSVMRAKPVRKNYLYR